MPLLALPALAATLPKSEAVAPVDVYFAGIAYTGDKAAADEAFPYSSALLNADGQIVTLNAALRAGFQQTPPPALNIKYGELASLDGSTSAIALAAGIDRETVVVEQIGEHYKILVEIAANALFFDFREKMVVATRPVTLQRIETTTTPPDDARIREVVRYLLTSPTEDAFVASVVAAVHGTVMPEASSRRLQVASMVLSEAAKAELASGGRDVEVLPAMLATELTKYFGERQRISLLPYQKGQAIGGAMSARFADGRVYRLSIPTPDYAINVEVDALKSKVIQETAVARNILYGAYFRISVIEPLSGQTYFSQSLRQGSTRAIPLTQEQVDHSAAHYENLLIGFDAFARAIDDPRSTWAREQPDPKALPKQFKQLTELLRTCR
jgi:hypothetical protein